MHESEKWKWSLSEYREMKIGLGRSPGEGNGNPLQYYCLENPMDRGAWWATVYGVAKSRTRLSAFTFAFRSWGWSPHDEISALVKENAERSLALFAMRRQDEKLVIGEPGSRLSPGTEFTSIFFLNFPSSRMVRNKFLLFMSHQSMVFLNSSRNRLRQ